MFELWLVQVVVLVDDIVQVLDANVVIALAISLSYNNRRVRDTVDDGYYVMMVRISI